MTSEKKIEVLNRAIGYRECILDILDSDLVHGDVLDKIIAMGNVRYSLKAIDEVLDNE